MIRTQRSLSLFSRSWKDTRPDSPNNSGSAAELLRSNFAWQHHLYPFDSTQQRVGPCDPQLADL